MVYLTTLMVITNTMLLGVNALDKVTADAIKNNLIQAKIIPKAIKEFEPLTTLKITFDEVNELENGKHLKPEETLVAPSVWFDPPNIDAQYTLAMINLDSNGVMLRHWIATNAQGGDEKGNAFLSQKANRQYTSYKGPTPPAGSTNHRVVFILYEQQVKNQTFVPEIDGRSTRGRSLFNLAEFVQQNKLKPVSAAYFFTDYQEGLSQQYPSLPHTVSGEVHEAGLVSEILDDVGNLLDIDDILGITTGIGKNDTDNNNQDGSENPSVNLPNTTVPEGGNWLSGILNTIENLLRQILNNNGRNTETGNNNAPANNEKISDDEINDDYVYHIDRKSIDIPSVSISAPSSSSFSRADVKQQGLVGDLIHDLDDILGIDINIGYHDNDNNDNNGNGVHIGLGLKRPAKPASASASASAIKPNNRLELSSVIVDNSLDIINANIKSVNADSNEIEHNHHQSSSRSNSNDNDETIIVQFGSNLNRAYPPPHDAYIAQSGPSAIRPSASVF